MSDFSPEPGGAPAHEGVVVLTTWPADRDATPFARTLVEERLAACVGVLPEMRSHYRWASGVQDEAERQILIKTTRGRIEALRARVAVLHPYDVPEWLVLRAEGSQAYLAWLRDSVAPLA